MIAEYIDTIEKQFFSEHNFMVVPDLICSYFENKEFELVYYFAEEYMSEFEQCEFYYMMALMELENYDRALTIYKKYRGDWFQRCKQYDIYWKHVVLFALYFKELDITEYYLDVFDEYYDYEPVQLLEYLSENRTAHIHRSEIYKSVAATYPVVGFVYGEDENNKAPAVLTFEDIQWKVWHKYNQSIHNGNYLGVEKTYNRDGYEIYSYLPKQASASMHILRYDNTVIVLDCGCEILGDTTKRIPVKEILQDLGIEHIDAIFISHAHMDHYGSLNEIRNTCIYMSDTTYQLIKCVSPEVNLRNVKVVNPYDIIDVNGFKVRFVPNGHIAGSVLFDINYKSKLRIVYTGDFSIVNQATVKALSVDDILDYDKKRIDILLTETTYGKKKDMLTQEQYEKIFVDLCHKHVKYGNKIFIPCFAIGRIQEVALLLAPAAQKYGLKILIDGFASKITELYQNVIDSDHKIIGKNITTCHSEMDYKSKIDNYSIILASSGMIKEGSTSAGYVNNLLGQNNLCIMKVGFIHEREHLLQSIVNRKNSNLHYVNLPLSAHVGYKNLVDTIEKLSPDNVIYVHGEGIDK